MQQVNQTIHKAKEQSTSQTPTIPKFPYNNSAIKVAELAKTFLRIQDPKIKFRLDPEISRLYRLLTLYFTDNQEFENNYLQVDGGKIYYSLKKGNLLIGSTGRSKSFCYEKVFRAFTTSFVPEKKYRIINSHAVQSAFEKDGMKGLSLFRKNMHNEFDDLYIDEIGMEELTVQHFGNKQKPVGTLLHERHRLYITSGYKTHGSSNLKLNSTSELNFKEAYGDRNYSRLFEMFNIIVVAGTDDLRINIIADNEKL